MKYIKHKNQFPKVGFKALLWLGLIYSSLGQAIAQVAETTEPVVLKHEKIQVKKPVPGSHQDFEILNITNFLYPTKKH